MTSFRLFLATCGLVIVALVPAVNASPCSLETEAADLAWVNVSPTGSQPFRINLDKRPLTATPGENGISTIQVASPLRFTATQATNGLGARLKRRTAMAGGRIVLAKGHEPTFVPLTGTAFETASEADSLRVSLPLSSLTVETPLALPCASLSISHSAKDFLRPEIKRPSHAVRFVKTDEVIELYEKTKAVDPLAIRLASSWTVVAERQHWVRLQAKWSDGSLVRGWVKSEALTIQEGLPPDDGELSGSGGMGMCGGGHRGVVTGVTVHSHAPVHDGPGGAIWAHAAGNIVVDVVATFRADGWIQVATIEGIPKQNCGEHRRIWVHAKHILWAPVAVAR